MKVEVRPIDIPKWHGKKGKEAFARVKCFAGIPAEFAGKETIVFENASVDKLPNVKFVTVQRISEFLGGNR